MEIVVCPMCQGKGRVLQYSSSYTTNGDLGMMKCGMCDGTGVLGDYYLIWKGSLQYLRSLSWRSLKDDPPDDKELVFVCETGINVVNKGFYLDDVFRSRHPTVINPTHWMPLPKAHGVE